MIQHQLIDTVLADLIREFLLVRGAGHGFDVLEL